MLAAQAARADALRRAREVFAVSARGCGIASATRRDVREPGGRCRGRRGICGDRRRPSRRRFGGGGRRWRSPWRSAICRANSASSERRDTCPISPMRRSKRALETALTERVPGAEVPGDHRARARQARQPRAQLFVGRRPAAAVRSRDPAAARARRSVGEAAVRDRPPDHRASAEADRRRLCRPRRPAASAVAGSHADRPAGQRGDLAL